MPTTSCQGGNRAQTGVFCKCLLIAEPPKGWFRVLVGRMVMGAMGKQSWGGEGLGNHIDG